jgi:hypothetical protein
MSATQIANVLSQVLGGTYFSYAAVAQLLSALGAGREVTDADRRSSDASNTPLAEARLADADISQASSIIADAAARLGFRGDLGELLLRLCPPAGEGDAFVPYLQVLDYIAVIAEVVDHPPAYLYEFHPRGGFAVSLFNDYPTALASAGNPALNNFKAVEAADRAWARSRPKNRSQSFALVSILEGLSQMPHPSRRDLASWLRQWLKHAVVLLNVTPQHQFDVPRISITHIDRLLEWVSTANTGTAGVVEQRAVDALSVLLHPHSDGWRHRGLGDAVNISNVARKKLGDAEFQNAAARTIFAYEPHGGRLYAPYLEGHRKTIERVIRARLEDWRSIAEPTEWHLTVKFVAHTIGPGVSLLTEEDILGLRLTTEVEFFGDFVAHALDQSAEPDILAAFAAHFFQTLNRPQTSQRVRDQVAEKCGAPVIAPESP